MTDTAAPELDLQQEPVPTPANPPPEPATPELTAHQQFLEMLPDDLKTDPSFTDFKGENINEVIGKLGKSYVNTKKLVGADKNALLKIPSSEDDADGWNAVYTKLGRPETPDGYKLEEKYKDIPGVVPENMKEITKIAHENGVSAKALDAIVGKYFEQAGAIEETSEAEVEKMQTGYIEALKGEWGEAYEQKTSKVLNSLKEHATPGFLELAADYPHIFDNPEVMKTLDNFIKLSSEDAGPRKGGSSGDAHMTPAEAMSEINKMEGDDEIKKIMLNSGDPRRGDLIARRTKLFEYAYPKK